MKISFLIGLILSAALCSCARAAAEDDLDAALAAKKKKVRRRVYSQRANLVDQRLVIPQTPDERDRELDQKLKQMENQLTPGPQGSAAPRIPRRSAPTEAKPSNWLTPDMMAEKEAVLPEKKNEWITLELDRQQTIRDQAVAAEQEQALVNRMLKEQASDNFQKNDSPASAYRSPLKDLGTLGARNRPTDYEKPQPFNAIPGRNSIQSRKETSPFSPSVRSSSGVISSPFGISSRNSSSKAQTSSTLQSDWTSKRQSSRQNFSTDLKPEWGEKKTESLSPLQRIKKASPINRKNPFEEEFVPRFKSSIWDD